MQNKKPRFFHSENEKDFFAWLGLYVSTWSSVEYGLFSCLKVLSLVTKDNFEHKPIAFSSKLKLFRNAFNHLLLQDELEEAEAIADFLQRESDFRHSIIHGVNARFRLPDGEWFNQQWMPERHKDPESDNIVVIDQKVLEEHYNEIGMAIFGLIALNQRTMKKLEDIITQAEKSTSQPDKQQ